MSERFAKIKIVFNDETEDIYTSLPSFCLDYNHVWISVRGEQTGLDTMYPIHRIKQIEILGYE